MITLRLHCVELDERDVARCVFCGRIGAHTRKFLCPGVPQFEWGAVPEGFFTQRQLSEKGFKPGPIAAVVYYSKADDGYLKFYRLEDAAPKKAQSEKAKESAKVRGEAIRQGWTCQRCGDRLRRYVKGGGLCRVCSDHLEMVDWARECIATGYVVLDTETTALDGEFVEIAVIDHTGAVLINTRLMPDDPARLLTSGASAVNKITPEMLTGAPRFAEVYDALAAALHGRRVLIYNADFDWPLMKRTCKRYGLPVPTCEVECAMLAYAQWAGDWSHHWGSYRWQPLGGDHSALGDCRAVIGCIRDMAELEKGGNSNE